jgi:hypothetical protein
MRCGDAIFFITFFLPPCLSSQLSALWDSLPGVVTRSDGNSSAIWHVYYDTCLICSQGPAIPTELRKYSPVNNTTLQDDTVAFVVARAFAPPRGVFGKVLLDAYHIVPMPGDPSSDSYDEQLPDFPNPLVFAMGVVTSRPATCDTVPGLPGSVMTFTLTLSEYVRGGAKESTLEYV